MSSRVLVLTRGLPASGKTTQALAWVNGDTAKRARCNRDDLRMTLFGVYHGLDYQQEKAVTQAQRSAVKALLEGGRSVVVDDTNLRLKYAREWADLAHSLGVGFAVIDVDTDVEECVRRDKLRGEEGGRTVGEEVIRGFADRYGKKPWPDVTPTEKKPELQFPLWRPSPGLRSVWLFDLDGTLAHNDGHRGWYGNEELKVGRDTPIYPVARVAKSLVAEDPILFMSGRTERCREQTIDWISEHLLMTANDNNLFMRAVGDQRKDDVVKNELFEKHIAGKYNVIGVFDDRPQVVRMWRAKGLHVFDVNGRGEF